MGQWGEKGREEGRGASRWMGHGCKKRDGTDDDGDVDVDVDAAAGFDEMRDGNDKMCQIPGNGTSA